MKKGKTRLIILLVIVAVVLISTGTILEIIKINNTYKIATKSLNSLYQDKNNTIPKENITEDNIKEVKQNINKIYQTKDKNKMSKTLNELNKYVQLKNSIDNLFDQETLKYSVTDENISNVFKDYNRLEEKYKSLLTKKIDNIKTQKENINQLTMSINTLFKNQEKSEIQDNLTREQINVVKQLLDSLPQKNNMETEKNYISQAENLLTQKEELERKKQEEQERKRKEEEIKNSWVILNVPYISQNHNNVLNGCEVASLLMGLQYKGYLQNMDLQTYSTNIPKTENPNTGFFRSIFDLEPTDLPHWIAPEPLAQYGRETSGNSNVVNMTGATLDQLDQELENNNPVIIYATAMFETPKNWIEEVPNNVHVMLLTGYNKITKEQIITDPWTYKTGRTKWTLAKNKLENLYNKIGKRAVAIR